MDATRICLGQMLVRNCQVQILGIQRGSQLTGPEHESWTPHSKQLYTVCLRNLRNTIAHPKR